MSQIATTPATALTDRDVATSLLADAKACTKQLAAAALEASSPELRRLFERQLTSHLKEQEAIFRYMHEKKWYNPEMGPLAMARSDLDYAERSLR